jgi:probable HAF family extracellular repeat protein
VNVLARSVLILALAALLVGVAWGAGEDRSRATRYHVTNLESLGGSLSWAQSINNRAWIAGPSTLEGNGVVRATLWRPGSTAGRDLGTLGGPNSSVLWPVENVRGVVTGIAETGELDPENERWSCSRFFPSRTGRQCLGFAWHDGEMRPLPTLGGNNGFATGSNNRLQIVGWAENTVRDDSCSEVDEQYFQFRAVVWGPGKRQIRELLPLTGHSASAATAINDRGDVVGISGDCDRAFGRFSAISAVLWRNGRPTDIGNLGGVAWNTPMAINQRGDIVGFANASAADGGTFRPHGFLKLRGERIRPLRPLPGDAVSQALGINDRRQVVGTSCTAGFASCRAFIWEDGVMRDLNGLLVHGYPDHLSSANDINDRGQITGEAIERSSGASVPFKATPLRRGGDRSHDAATSRVPLPGPARQRLMARLGVRETDLPR